jgi:ATP-dependent DNA helicase RecG
MEQRFGATFSHLTEVQKLALTTVAVEGKVTHGRLHEMTSAHPRDVTLALASLVQRRMLESSGAHKATCYFFPDEPPAEEPGLAFLGASATPQVAPAGDTPPGAGNDATSSEHSRPSSEHNGLSSEHNGLSSEHNDSVLSAEASALEAIAAPLQQKRRVSPDVMRATLLRLCQGRSLTLAQLAKLTGRSPTTLRTHYLSALVEEGKMALRYPGNPTHPDQGYTTAEKPPAE